MKRLLFQSLSEYGMAVVLLLLCAYYSWATLQHRSAVGAEAGADAAAQVLNATSKPMSVALVAGNSAEDQQFAEAAKAKLQQGGVTSITEIPGQPPAARKALSELAAGPAKPAAIITTSECAAWLPRVLENVPALKEIAIISPQARTWPTFLLADNLLNVANQIVVIAVIAVGMTAVIITGGIDLSVGSLVAFSAVIAGRLIRDYAGGTNAGTGGLIVCCVAAIVAAGLVGAFSGAMVTLFKVPPFIATLAMMQVASGAAYIFANGQSIYDIPASFTWLGRGAGLLNVPNAVWLMLGLFAVAHVVMTHTRLGRYIYAVGGNAEAARLSGVRVGLILMIVYVLSGMAAGLGGVIVASQLKSSSPTYGLSYELYVIAAVVVGGTSLAGGEGKMLGTLIGALIIAVIQNGMNLTGVESYRQKVVLGFVILAAVLIDRLKRRPWKLPYFLRPAPPVLDGEASLAVAPQVAERQAEVGMN